MGLRREKRGVDSELELGSGSRGMEGKKSEIP